MLPNLKLNTKKYSDNFEVQPSSLGAFFDDQLNNGTQVGFDGVILRFNHEYKRVYGTYWGGTNADGITDVAFQKNSFNSNHNVVFTGVTSSANNSFPLKDIRGFNDYFDFNAITSPGQLDPPLLGPQSFVSNLYNTSTPLRIYQEYSSNSVKNNVIYDIHPNPFSNFIVINSPSEIFKNIRVFNMFGNQFLNITENQEHIQTINTESFIPGVYIIELNNGSGSIFRKKIIKN